MSDLFNQFKPVRGFEGYYEISRRGEIRSLKRVVARKNGQRARLQERILKQEKKTITLCKHAFMYQFYVADLVDQEFGSGKKAEPTYVAAISSERGKKKPAKTKAKTVIAPSAPEPHKTDVSEKTVKAVILRHWKLSRGRKDFIPAEGLRNICNEFSLPHAVVADIVYMRRFANITDKYLDELINA